MALSSLQRAELPSEVPCLPAALATRATRMSKVMKEKSRTLIPALGLEVGSLRREGHVRTSKYLLARR